MKYNAYLETLDTKWRSKIPKWKQIQSNVCAIVSISDWLAQAPTHKWFTCAAAHYLVQLCSEQGRERNRILDLQALSVTVALEP